MNRRLALVRPGQSTDPDFALPTLSTDSIALTLERAGPLDLVGDIDVLRRYKRHKYNAVAVGCGRGVGGAGDYVRLASIPAPLFEKLVLSSQARAAFSSGHHLELMAEAREEWYALRLEDAIDDAPPTELRGMSLSAVQSLEAVEQPVAPGSSAMYALVHEMQIKHLFAKYVEHIGDQGEASVEAMRHQHDTMPRFGKLSPTTAAKAGRGGILCKEDDEEAKGGDGIAWEALGGRDSHKGVSTTGGGSSAASTAESSHGAMGGRGGENSIGFMFPRRARRRSSAFGQAISLEAAAAAAAMSLSPDASPDHHTQPGRAAAELDDVLQHDVAGTPHAHN